MSDASPQTAPIAFEDFLKVDVRVGTVLSAVAHRTARKPAYILELDFGPRLGRRTTSAQLTTLYTPEQLIGRQVAAVVNFPPKRIAGIKSEVLVLGFPDAAGNVVLIGVDHPVPNGGRLF